MESTLNESYQTNVETPLQRPDFLKILCILSFVACGLMILLCGLGTMALALDEPTIEKVWTQVVESSPQLAELDAVTFVHQFGMICVYTLIANIFSLIGVILMWRLERIGLLIYAIAELSTHFFAIDMGQKESSSYLGLIFWILVDLVFIIMYFTNLKYMNKKNNNTFIQSGS